MLYVFHVDAGNMTTFDMTLTMESVSNLRLAIERKTKLPASSLVLLVSGGKVLQPNQKVSSYHSGTDTSPIFMFSRPSYVDEGLKQSQQLSADYECLSPMVELSPSTEAEWRYGCEMKPSVDLGPAVDNICSLAPSVATINTSANLAQQFKDLARDYARNCEQLVHDQHLQHQGWAAVVANLEDISNEFYDRSQTFKQAFEDYKSKKEEYQQLLDNLNSVLATLGKIPMLDALQANAIANPFTGFDDFDDDFNDFDDLTAQIDNYNDKGQADFDVHPFKMSEEDVFSQAKSDNKTSGEKTNLTNSDEGVSFEAHPEKLKRDLEHETLLNWILAKENEESLQDILDYCGKGLLIMDADPSKETEKELYQLLEFARKHGLNQIKGIEDRLFGLEELLTQVRNIEKDQNVLANAILQNQQRVALVSEPTVLPTLCTSHKVQLHAMLKNHDDLLDIRTRCHKSKEELGVILKARLGAVLRIENLMATADAHQLLHYQCATRLHHYFTAMRQLAKAPSLFTRAMHEVTRRRTFSEAFLTWATELASHLQSIYQDEVNRRQEFNNDFNKHFLTKLFVGTEDLPPNFGTQIPPAFDTRLPQLTEEDTKKIDEQFPDLVKDVRSYDMKPVIQFFSSRVISQMSTEIDKQEDNMEQNAIERDLESEAEAGGFEKLNSSMGGRTTSIAVETEVYYVNNTMEFQHDDFYIDETPNWELHQDNMFSESLLSDKLRKCLLDLIAMVRANLVGFRDELVKVKNDYQVQQLSIKCEWDELLEAWCKGEEENNVRYREQTQRLTFDHELEMSDIKKDLEMKDDIINCLKEERVQLEQLHKLELESLRHQQSDLYEHIEKLKTELSEANQKLADAESVKQKEIKEMHDKLSHEYKGEIESLRSRFRLVAITNSDRSPSESSLEKIERTDMIEISSHNAILRQTQENAEVEKEEAIKEAIFKCEAEWAAKLQDETKRNESANDVLKRIIDEKDKHIEKLHERESQLSRDVTKYRHSLQQIAEDASLQPNSSSSSNRRWSGHSPVGLPAGTLNLTDCNSDSTVLVIWDPTHRSYTVLQESSIMYFVHSDCLAALDLQLHVKHESERKQYALAIVESKEYCYAKKSSNRYKVPRGSKFYRVRVKPYNSRSKPTCCSTIDIGAPSLSLYREPRHVKKWLTYLHAPVSVTQAGSQSTSSATDDSISTTDRSEVDSGIITRDLSKNSQLLQSNTLDDSSICMDESTMLCPSEENLDSIEANVECSSPTIEQYPSDGPLEMTVSTQSVIPIGEQTLQLMPDLLESEVAEEATP